MSRQPLITAGEIPPRIREDMETTARRHLPRGGWDPALDPPWDRGQLALGRGSALRALRYHFPAWRFNLRAGLLEVSRAADPQP